MIWQCGRSDGNGGRSGVVCINVSLAEKERKSAVKRENTAVI
jgi:hypothetical protein